MSGPNTAVGAVFGKYRLIAKLATGGMGEIFLARFKGAANFEKLVVIKRLLPHLAEDEHFVKMLVHEATIAAGLSHPNVCQVHDLGEVDGQFFIAMEYMEGVSCSQVLSRARKEGKWLDIRLAAAVLIQTCEGLHHAHELTDRNGNEIGIVHRDISPSNLFLTTNGLVKVLDFGVAKSRNASARTHTGALKGKYAYMSPEQVMAQPIDKRSDIFSLGIVFWEMLTTKRLFWRETEFLMFQAIADDPIPLVSEHRDNVPAGLAAVVARALHRDPAERFASARELADATRAALQPLGGVVSISKLADYVKTRFEEPIRERRELVASAAGEEALEPSGVSAVTESMHAPSRGTRPLGAISSVGDSLPETEATRVSLSPGPVIVHESSRRHETRGASFWVALVSLVVVTAGGVSFWAYAARQDREPQDEIVVVVDNTDEAKRRNARAVVQAHADEKNDGTEADAASGETNTASTADASVPPRDAGARPSRDAGTGRDASVGRDAGHEKSNPGDRAEIVDPKGSSSASPGNGDRSIEQVLADKRGDFRECANQHLNEVLGEPTVLVSFEIDGNGRARSVHLSQGLSELPYGKCVIAVVRSLRFGPEYADQQVEIPLHIRTVKRPSE